MSLDCGQGPDIIERIVIEGGSSGEEGSSIDLPLDSSQVVDDGVTLDIVLDDLRDLIDDLQSQINIGLYVDAEVISFTKSINSVEVGSTVSSINFFWLTNKSITSQTLTGGSLNPSLSAAARSYVASGLSITTPTVFTITINDGSGNSGAIDSETTTLNFYNKIFYGARAIPGVFNDAFLSLLSSEVSQTVSKTFTATAGSLDYFWFACPTAYGVPTFTVGGFEGGFIEAGTMNHSLPDASTEEYKIYRSSLANLGETTIEVS